PTDGNCMILLFFLQYKFLLLIDLSHRSSAMIVFFFFQAEDGIRDGHVTGVQTCALPIYTLVFGDEGIGVPASIYSGSSMKRLFLSLLTMVAVAACASPLAKAETPQQALAGAAQRASQLHSAKFDMQANVNMTFPPQMGQIF